MLSQCPVKGGAVHVQERGRIFTTMLSSVDQLPGVVKALAWIYSPAA